MSGAADMIEIVLDEKRCQGYGNCVPILPEAFKLEPGAKRAELLAAHLPEEQLEDIQEAIRNCPARAIKMMRG